MSAQEENHPVDPQNISHNSQFSYIPSFPSPYTQNFFPPLNQQNFNWAQWGSTSAALQALNLNHQSSNGLNGFGMPMSQTMGQTMDMNDSGFSSMHSAFDASQQSIPDPLHPSQFQSPTPTNASTKSHSTSTTNQEYDEDKYCKIPGRLGLLNNNKSYLIGMDELKRRLNSPEKLNISYLNGIIRKAKGQAAGHNLRIKLQKNGLDVEHGRRANVKITGFVPICEAESVQIAQDFDFLLGKFMPRKSLKQALRAKVKANLKTIRSDVGILRKTIQKGEDSTATLIKLFQILPQELAKIFNEDQTRKIQLEHQSGFFPQRNADIPFPSQLQQELWELNLATHNFAGPGLKATFLNTSTPIEQIPSSSHAHKIEPSNNFQF